MTNLKTIELKTFLPSKDFEVSKQFYADLGFTKASDENGMAYFHHGDCSFLLQNFYEPTFAENLMMHLLVEDVHAWHEQVTASGIADKYSVKVSSVTQQPWGMLDFIVFDPSGVLWRFGQNI